MGTRGRIELGEGNGVAVVEGRDEVAQRGGWVSRVATGSGFVNEPRLVATAPRRASQVEFETLAAHPKVACGVLLEDLIAAR